MNAELLQRISLLGVEVETHLVEPIEAFRHVDFVFDELTGDVSLMDVFNDEMFEFATSDRWLFIKNSVSKDVQGVFHRIEDTLKR